MCQRGSSLYLNFVQRTELYFYVSGSLSLSLSLILYPDLFLLVQTLLRVERRLVLRVCTLRFAVWKRLQLVRVMYSVFYDQETPIACKQ